VPARLINIKYITIRAEKVASPVTALQSKAVTMGGMSDGRAEAMQNMVWVM